MKFQTEKEKRVISRTDQLVIGFILHEIRNEFGKDIDFIQKGKTRCREDDAKPRQIAYYLSKKFSATSTRMGIAKFFKTTRSNHIFAEARIRDLTEDNRTFQYLMKRISQKIEQRIESLHARS